jgi:hypothetical protein
MTKMSVVRMGHMIRACGILLALEEVPTCDVT